MRPDEYEHIVAHYFESKGYETEVSQYSGDYGVDVFAKKGKTKIAIQAKMFGGSSRPVNRKMIMELHGAKDYFDCTKAVLATNGRVLNDANEVAKKLQIDISHIPAKGEIKINKPVRSREKSKSNKPEMTSVVNNGAFEVIWEQHVMPLEGKTLFNSRGKTNKILTVDWSGITRLTSNGKKQTIKIEIFKKTVNHLLRYGNISRKAINDQYSGRASSGIVLILGHTQAFEIVNRPKGLVKV